MTSLLPIDHLSASSVNKFLRCPRQWQDSYILGRKGSVGNALIIGSFVHLALSRRMSGKPDNFGGDWLSAVEKDEDAEIIWKEDPDTSFRIGMKMISDYWEAVGKHLKTVKTEQEFNVEIEGVGVPVVGFIDLETINTAIDYKSTAYYNRKQVRPNREWIFQGKVYQIIVPKPFEIHVITRAKEDSIVVPTSQSHPLHVRAGSPDRTAKIIRDAWSRMNWYAETLGLEQPWEGNPLHEWAGKYCGLGEECCKL
jgi:hypothetical protein